MNKEKSVHIATGVWYNLGFSHTRYHHFPCNIQYEHYYTGSNKYISALESCEPITKSSWGDDYDMLNGAKPRSTRELINLTKTVCNDFLESASIFAKVELPMVSMSISRLISGATCYQGKKGYMDIQQDYDHTHNFIYSKVNCLVTPSNISDVLGKKIERIHVIDSLDIMLWDQQSKLDPNTPLYIYNCDEYEAGAVYVKKLAPDTEVVNTNLCMINPNATRHIPSQIAELFRKKTAPIIRASQQKGSR